MNLYVCFGGSGSGGRVLVGHVFGCLVGHVFGGGGGHTSTMMIALTALQALHQIFLQSFSASNFPRTITLLALSSNSIFSMQ
jgi:hypothetical protein